MRNKWSICFFCFLFLSCSTYDKNDALDKFKNLLEGNVWCKVDTGQKFFFKEGVLALLENDKYVQIGNYTLSVRPHRGLGVDWYLAFQSIVINVNDNKYEFELKGRNKEYLNFRNSKTHKMFFLSEKCVLKSLDSVDYNMSKDFGYKQIELK